jgi:hypothetical protein
MKGDMNADVAIVVFSSCTREENLLVTEIDP